MLPFLYITVLTLSIGVDCLPSLHSTKYKSSMKHFHPRGKVHIDTMTTRRYGTVIFEHFNQNQWFQYAVIATSAAVSLKLERFKIGQLLSTPVCSMLISVILTNINVLPAEGSSSIRQLVDISVKLATPLLLLDADFKRIYKETGGSLLFAFLLGTFGTLLGELISFKCYILMKCEC